MVLQVSNLKILLGNLCIREHAKRQFSLMTQLQSFADEYHNQVTWFAIILLLLLRIPFTLAIIYLLPIENQNGGAVYEVCTYVLTAFLIWWERDRLAEFHIDKPALFLILFFRPLQTLILSYWDVDTPMVFPGFPNLMIWFTSITLLLALLRSGIKLSSISASTWSWTGIGILSGIAVSILKDFASFRSMLSNDGHFFPLLATSTSLNVLYHLGFAPLNEEPLFRGFLWGALRQRNWHNGSILIVQAILFTGAHAYFAKQYPFEFWIFIPAAAILFGILTMRSRSIAPAILAHAMINGSAYVLAAGILSEF
jgi:membrane protease YdiL (CAAX protease family)